MKETVSVVGLGYVGLPVAVAMSRKFPTIGFDINEKRVSALREGRDITQQIDEKDLQESRIEFTCNLEDLKKATVHIVTVPTPVDDANRPDIACLVKASESVGKILKKGDMVIYESTVYPGLTEEECAPILERMSGLKMGVDFDLGYSPERINPGDHEHTFTRIRKIVSAQDAQALKRITALYGAVVEAGVFEAASIKVAESAKIIENIQRDINIALINELALVFQRIGVDTHDVLAAAGTKWNFLPFRPGLVGGHCIGVDPYYLTHKSEQLGYLPQVILAGRRINNEMGRYLAQNVIRELVISGHNPKGSIVTILGISFKENCPDIRNSKVIDIVRELERYQVNVQVADPLADVEETFDEYKVRVIPMNDVKPAHAIVLAVAHDEFRSLSADDFTKMSAVAPLVIDVKAILKKDFFEGRQGRVWRL